MIQSRFFQTLRSPHPRLQTFLTGLVFLVGLLLLATPALAHHGMDNQTPSNFLEGFISGLAHPIIGLDHFAFVIAVGLLAATKPKGRAIPIAFVLAALAGTGLHLSAITLPLPELWIALSVFAIGLYLALGTQLPTTALAGLAGLAGLFHGYAYGEAIMGAEPTPLIAYLIGFTTIQMGIALGAFWLSQRGLAQRHTITDAAKQSLRKAGWAIGGMGLVFLYAHVLG